MDAFWHVVGYIALGVIGLAALALLGIWYMGKMMDPRGGAR